MRLIAIIIISITLTTGSFAQNNSSNNEDAIWLDGYAYLSSGEKVKGKIGYFFLNQSIQIKSKGSINSYHAKNVNRFTMYKPDEKKIDFVSFPVKITKKVKANDFQTKTKTIGEQYQFLCIQHQNKKAAILSNLNYDQEVYTYNSNLNDLGSGNRSVYRATLNERVYILDKRGTPFTLLFRTLDKSNNPKNGVNYYKQNFGISNTQPDKESHKFNQENPKYKLVNKDFLEELDPRNYRKLEAYIEKEDIDIKTVEGLIEVIDYWSEI